MPPASRRVFIVIKAPNGDVREVPVTPSAIVIGRDESADIRVEDKKVSRRHAAFKLIDGEPWVEDLGSANGVKLNGKRIDKRAKMRGDDKVKVGGYLVTLKASGDDTASFLGVEERPLSQTAAPVAARDPGRDGAREGGRDGGREPSRAIARDEVTPSRTAALGATAIRPPKKGAVLPDDGKSPVLVALDEPVKDQRFVLHAGENIIGRLEECDIPVLDGSVSRQHARVVFARDRISVTDLGSSNGSFVNENRVEMGELADGDTLRIGNIRFKLELPPELAKSTAPGSSAKARAKAKARPASAPSSPLRKLAVVGVVIALIAIAVLSYTIWWKLKARGGSDPTKPLLFALKGGGADAGDDGSSLGEDAGSRVRGFDSVTTPRADVDAGAVPIAKPDAAKPDAGAIAQVKPKRDAGLPFAPPTAFENEVKDAGLARPAVSAGTSSAATTPELAATSTTPRMPVLPPVVTATAPYLAKDERGMPRDLPTVDESFDFDAFVADRLAQVEKAEQAGDNAKLRAVLTELLTVDPINIDAKAAWKKMVVRETAKAAFAKAEARLEKGDLAGAIELYAEVPDGAPETPKARLRQEELRPRAIAQELDRADEEAKNKATWMRAHKRYRAVLELEPESTRALEGVRDVERKMRGKNLRFAAYVPATAKSKPRETPEDIDNAIARMYPGDPALASVAALYAQGSMSKAVKSAEALEKKAEGAKKDAAKRVRGSLKTIQQLYERIRNEIANDPNVAWAKLLELQRAEDGILPSDVKSYVRKELEESVAEAFANAGASLFDREKLEDAFLRWDAGWKLDPTNPKLVAGLKKLDDRAKQLADEAELSAQRGERKACDKFKAITHITRADSEVHKRALDRARQVCAQN